MQSLQTVIDELSQLENEIRDSGPIAPAGCWIDTYSPAGRAKVYARKRSDCAMWNGKKTKGLGPVGSDAHREFEADVKLRNALEEISRLAIALKEMIDSPIAF